MTGIDIGTGVNLPLSGWALKGNTTPSRQAATPPPRSGGNGADLQAAGAVAAGTGAMLSAIGAFYTAKSQQAGLKSAALSAEFDASIASLNARGAEQDAQDILADKNREIGMLGLQYAQAKASRRASTGASGVEIGVGSAAEVQATTELAHQIDAISVDANATRAANAMRMQAVDFRNRSMLSRVSADNARRSARAIMPWVSAGISLVSSASSMAAPMAFGGGGAR